jgi:hypothetical protein
MLREFLALFLLLCLVGGTPNASSFLDARSPGGGGRLPGHLDSKFVRSDRGKQYIRLLTQPFGMLARYVAQACLQTGLTYFRTFGAGLGSSQF